MEGALRFISSSEPAAVRLRDQAIFRFTPMMDPDGCANGKVRFNANGYDVNRHWDEVNLRDKEYLERMPEIWYVKKAIVSCRPAVDLMLNLHNTETGEYVDTQTTDERERTKMRAFFEALKATSTFDPAQPFRVNNNPGNTTNCLWDQGHVPVMLMEQRISAGKKLGHQPTVQDRLAFGKDLIQRLAEACL